ncbi:MAG TPA: hypoxanthine phosphoribosyltransferase [Candidatus Obscuribacter sp.]|nr:hypoxanthine phosphoribosyltransferase [Candidatus Obscuribacter sp.]HMX45693.1 hypoxanthine phosphoribosyltransferase [Candidatus Obscuribacter sp.]HMY03086.1 hypoxanthine phosphoribosyltransferase [Candidatus Obscuribacter sp.]HMY52295.1 hypoxanthine phosphoribosyltransferase [Candidatus Obscuribacter sp.]HNB14724.1 hypoxanthine phosphoribosyltransferase [Candidatus Obscuribacter sp.]
MATQVDSIRTIYSQPEIQERIKEMGQQISSDYAKLEHPVVIGVMKGAFCFLADIVRQIKTPDPLQIEFVRLASYGSATESSGSVQTPYLELPNISRRNILVVEDIIDSGRTARFFMDYLKDQFNPATLKMAVFLDKPSRRVVPMEADYVGFTIEDLFVVGYGLDYAEKYRELPYLGELKLGGG